MVGALVQYQILLRRVAMVAHDAWFYLMHTLFHYCKPLYKHFHRLHHSNGSNISSLGTAYGDAVDIGMCFVAFHAVIYHVLNQMDSWSLPAVVALISVEVGALPFDCAGKCDRCLLWAIPSDIDNGDSTPILKSIFSWVQACGLSSCMLDI